MMNKIIYTIEQMKEFAELNDGKCLSTVFIDSKIDIEWQCHSGHKFLRKIPEVKKGIWCPVCRKNKINDFKLNELREVAVNKGGELLSTKYNLSTDRYKFKCKKGHIFDKIAYYVTGPRKSWCLMCLRKERKNNG